MQFFFVNLLEPVCEDELRQLPRDEEQGPFLRSQTGATAGHAQRALHQVLGNQRCHKVFASIVVLKQLLLKNQDTL
jgi:hypothetical protein